ELIVLMRRARLGREATMIVELAPTRRVDLRVLQAARLRSRLAQLRLAGLDRLDPGDVVIASGETAGDPLQQAKRAAILGVHRTRGRLDLPLDHRREVLDARHARSLRGGSGLAG